MRLPENARSAPPPGRGVSGGRAANGLGSGGSGGQGVRVPFLPCCPLPAAAPRRWLIERAAVLDGRMSSIVLLDKGRLSAPDGQLLLLLFFFLFCMRRNAAELLWLGYFLINGNFEQPQSLLCRKYGLVFPDCGVVLV